MVETYGSCEVISQSSIPTGIDLNVKIRYNGNSSLSVEFIDMAAEYHQTKIRYEKLKKLNTRMEAKVICTSSEVEPQLDGTPARLLRDQQRIMGEYLHILELRAEIEEIFI